MSDSIKKKNWACSRCGKKDRKGRLVDHFLKEHVPEERVPYRCSLCKFRCQDALTLQRHLTAYARHVEAETKLGFKPTYLQILKRSNNPIFVTEDDLFALQPGPPGIVSGSSLSEDENPLPDWMSCAVPEYIPTAKTTLECDLNEFNVGSLSDWEPSVFQNNRSSEMMLAQPLQMGTPNPFMTTPKQTRVVASAPSTVDIVNVLPTLNDRQDPLFSGLDGDSAVEPLSLPPGIGGIEVALQTESHPVEDKTTQTSVEDRMAVVLEEWSKRFLGALDESVKASSSSSRAMAEIRDDVRRIERKVSMMARVIEGTQAVEEEPRGKENARSVVVKRSGPPMENVRCKDQRREDTRHMKIQH